MNIAVVGLGKLGCPLAAVLASAGHAVVGVDRNEKTVHAVNHGIAPVEEPGLAELLADPNLDLAASTSYDVVAGCDVTFVIVPTPSGGDGRFTNDFVLDAVRKIGHAIAGSDRRHLVVISSTVMPGSMESAVIPVLNKASGRKVTKRHLGVCYSPEFIALGSVIDDLRKPDMVLIGESDTRSGDQLEELMTTVVGVSVAKRRMSLVNAELAKIAVNAFITMKLSYANNLGEICEGLLGADAAVVAAAVGMDSRIGVSYLRPALAYGGPCFPRDTRAYAALASEVGTEANLAVAAQAINVRQTDRLVGRILSLLKEDAGVSVLGLAYKPYTTVTDESPGVALAEALIESGVRTTVYDPVARPAGFDVAPSLAAAIIGADVIVITTAWPEFALIEPLPDQVLIDCWGLVKGSDVLRVGQG